MGFVRVRTTSVLFSFFSVYRVFLFYFIAFIWNVIFSPRFFFLCPVAKKRYQAVGFPCNRMLKLSSSRGIRIDVPVLSVSWSFEDHSVIIQALRKGLIEHEASDTGGVPRWKSSCPDRLAEATLLVLVITFTFQLNS